MRNHRHLTNLTLQGKRGHTVVGLLRVGAFLFLRIFLRDLIFGCLSGDVGIGYDERSDGSSSIPKSLLGEMTTRWGKLKANMLYIKDLLP